MILHTIIDPLSLFHQAVKPANYRKVGGKICQVELLDSTFSVKRLISTRPADFLEKNTFPGEKIR